MAHFTPEELKANLDARCIISRLVVVIDLEDLVAASVSHNHLVAGAVVEEASTSSRL